MSTNDRVLLDSIIQGKRTQIASEMAEDDFFELFLAEQLLWDHNLSWEELQAGVTGGADDGGMDAIYIFCNGVLLDAGTDLSIPLRASATFELIIIQAKRSPSFTETAIEKISTSLLRLLDLNNELEDIRILYNADTLACFDRFRSYYLQNASNFPAVNVHIYYATRGFDINPKVTKKAVQLELDITALFSASTCKFHFITPSDLVAFARRQRPTTLDLRLEETIATSTGGFVGLASITNYFDFMRTENGDLRTAIFESNVRDYEGSGGINASIQKTLKEDSGEDFWWLNNGVTIVASRAAQYGKTLTLEYPQVVNGLQTSREIYKYVSEAKRETGGDIQDQRTVLIRIVVPPSDVSRDRIIRATNSQTSIPSVALRATDKIQRDIEDYFLRQGWFYERRKNRYQNDNKPISRIITIPYLAECMLAIFLKEPHVGGPRLGGRFLKSEDTYERIFNDSIPLASYLKCAQLCRSVELRLREQVELRLRRQRAREPQAQEPQAQGERRRRPRRQRPIRYRPHRYLLLIAMAIALSKSADVNLADLDLDSIDTDEITWWAQKIAELDPTLERPGLKADTAEKILTDKLLQVLREMT